MSPPKKKPGAGTRPTTRRSTARPATAGSGGAAGTAEAGPKGSAAGDRTARRDDPGAPGGGGRTVRGDDPKTSGAAAPAAAGGGVQAAGKRPAAARKAVANGAPALVVGAISPLARLAGVAAVLSAALLLLQPAFALVRDSGRGLGGSHNLWDFVVWLPAAALVAAAGVLCVLGRLPRLGLAALIAAGGYGLGQLVRTAALLDTGGHTSIDLPLPEGLVRSFRYTVGPGLVLQIVALAGLTLALILAVPAWRRTDMDDDRSFDPLRPTFGALGFAAALVGFGAAAFPPAAPVPGGLTITVPSLFDRSGLDLLGGWLLACAVTAAAVGAATVRPRLAVVGMFAGLAAMFATAGLGNLLLIVRSTALDLDTGTAMQLAAAVVFAGLAAAAWRITRRPAGEPD